MFVRCRVSFHEYFPYGRVEVGVRVPRPGLTRLCQDRLLTVNDDVELENGHTGPE